MRQVPLLYLFLTEMCWHWAHSESLWCNESAYQILVYFLEFLKYSIDYISIWINDLLNSKGLKQ